MNPDMNLLLAGRVALEALPPTDERRRRATAKRSRTTTSLVTAIVRRIFPARSRVAGQVSGERTRAPGGRELSKT
jgi:hypothetical protein